MIRGPYHHQAHRHSHPQQYYRPLPQFTLTLSRLPKNLNRNPLSLQTLIASIPFPFRHAIPTGGDHTTAAAILTFSTRAAALSASAFLWSCRLEGSHNLLPVISSNDPSLKADELKRVRNVFIEYIDNLLNCEVVDNLRKKGKDVKKEVDKKANLLKRPMKVGDMEVMRDEKERLEVELEMVNGRLEEFRVFLESLMNYLKEGKDRVLGDGEFDVFMFGKELDMEGFVRVQSILSREVVRLKDGLPIYASRRRLLETMFFNQVCVIIGETGSGKSTQLVQFIADSGLAATESIVCTQPRKIAAFSVAQRIKEESTGCYDDDSSIVSYPAYISSQEFKSKIIFMTDHCLLQHFMMKKNFEGISYIIIDEAHERSLNTDLLLALIKKALLQSDLRVIIMSATADASKLADYFYGCPTICVKGRNFPVEIKYVPNVYTDAALSRVPKLVSASCASYVFDAIMMVRLIHKNEEDGAILAFLTSQMEVEFACESFSDPSAIVLPMHGKLSHQDQSRVMQKYPGKRKIIFCTNVAETSLTIQDVRYVVDSGMVKECRFEPNTGINVLKVGWISQSSASQRRGRAGRTGPGKCYRLYSEYNFQSMKTHQEPEIRKVHLGIAILKILALGINNVQDFDFVDAPDLKAIEKAVLNLTHLGAIVLKNDSFEITDTGRRLVKLDIEPRLGKIILDSFGCGLKKEGLVLAAVMTNSSSIFCRVGSVEDKRKADCLKLPFCHKDGDLFTLLSVYKEWEEMHENKNRWCWENSVNAKSMRRCQDTFMELEKCLRHELNTIIPSYWYWNPQKPSDYDRLLKKIILSSLIENVAMYSGSEQLGYEVAISGRQVQLHPSCSLLAYGQKPNWVVFNEILSAENQYLVCVSAVEHEDLLNIQHPLFDVIQLESRKMSMNVIPGVRNNLLRRLCGKSNSNLQFIISHVRKECMDDRITIDVDFSRREIHIFAASKYMEKVSDIVTNYMESEKNLLRNECVEKKLFHDGVGNSPIALFGSGAVIKHLELEKKYLSVEIFHPIASELNDKEFLMMTEQYAPGIASYLKIAGTGFKCGDSDKWGKLTFLTPEYAKNAVAKLNKVIFHGYSLKVIPVVSDNHKIIPDSAVRAKLCWPRRRSKGLAIIHCAVVDAGVIVRDCLNLEFGGVFVKCEVSLYSRSCMFVSGIPKDVTESEIYEKIVSMTTRRILGVRLLKYDAITSASEATCTEALMNEIAPFMPNKCTNINFQVYIFIPKPEDHVMRATITFNGSLHLEAAKALDYIEGKVLPGCEPWQKIQCQHVFESSITCPDRIYNVIKYELNSLLGSFMRSKGVTYTMERLSIGAHRIKISANATKIVADVRKPLEQLITKGKIINHASITPSLLLYLTTRDGIQLLRSIEKETNTYILYDRQNLNVRVFGSQKSVTNAEGKLIKSLLSYHDRRPLEIHLRGHDLPSNLMKELVQKFGADLHGLKAIISDEVDLNLNTRRHSLYVRGTDEQKQRTQEIVFNLACSLKDLLISDKSYECPICLCDFDDPYMLESCGHEFCRTCLVEQCESVARSREGFPICCTKAECKQPFFILDLKSLLPADKLDELFRASLGYFVASSNGLYRFCPSPDCPSIYRVGTGPFLCKACLTETCTRCHLEYHPFITCELYKEFKETPDKSLMEWRKDKGHVKDCLSCGYTIEKVEGCNHVECRCGKHICWVCLQSYSTSNECYSHLRSENHMQS